MTIDRLETERGGVLRITEHTAKVADGVGSAQSTAPVDVAAVDLRVASAQAGGMLEGGLAQRVRIMARLQAGEWVSGQALAGLLGVSRAAVHKHVESLRGAGAPIVSVRGNGYRLTTPWDSLAPEAVLPLALGRRGESPPGGAAGVRVEFGLPYLYESETPSTNLLLKEAATKGLPGGTVAVTDHQVEGRGRLGRRWVSDAHRDVIVSLLIRPESVPHETPRLVVGATLAVAEVAYRIVGDGLEAGASTPTGRHATSAGVGIKWPNDVLIDGRKVCGILAEASMDMDRVHWVVMGIGLNVNGAPSALVSPEELQPGRPLPISLSERVGRVLPRAAVLALLLERLSCRLGEVVAGRWGPVRAAYEALDVLRGTEVVVRSGTGGELLTSGIAAGIDDLGRLLVRQPGGTVSAMAAGDVTISLG